jgi:hypothetical protein
MNLLALQRALWVAYLAAEVLLVGTICYNRLFRRYQIFVSYLALDVIGGVLLIQLDFHRPAYAYGFRIYQIAMLVLRLGAAAELYERILEHFLGIGKFRFYLAGVLTIMAGLITLATFRPGVSAQVGLPQTGVIMLQRFESTALCLTLLLTRFMLLKFLNIQPLIRSNVLNHWSILTLYFGISGLASAATILVGGGRAILPVNVTMLAADLACFMIWIRTFQKGGEIIPDVPPISAEDAAYHLEVKNAVLEEIERLVEKSREER